MSSDGERRDGPPKFVPGAEHPPVSPGLTAAPSQPAPSAPSQPAPSAPSQPAPAPSAPSQPAPSAPSQWALPTPGERIGGIESTPRAPVTPEPTTAITPVPPAAQPPYEAPAQTMRAWEMPTGPPVANPPVSTARLRRSLPKEVAVIFAVLQFVTVGCLFLVVYQSMQALSDFGLDANGEIAILVAFSGLSLVPAVLHIAPRTPQLSAGLCALAGVADIYLGYRYRLLLGFVDFVAEVTESASRVLVQVAWFVPFVGVGFLFLAGFHLLRRFDDAP